MFFLLLCAGVGALAFVVGGSLLRQTYEGLEKQKEQLAKRQEPPTAIG